jgi:DNA-directed RNA polymerase subunit RPC12/RpoP
LDVILALVAGYFIWRVSMAVIRMLSTPPPEVNPDDVVAVDQDYKCTICGAELTMKAINVQDAAAPRHCREDMIQVWRPADL